MSRSNSISLSFWQKFRHSHHLRELRYREAMCPTSSRSEPPGSAIVALSGMGRSRQASPGWVHLRDFPFLSGGFLTPFARTAPCFLGNGAFSPRRPSWTRARKPQSFRRNPDSISPGPSCPLPACHPPARHVVTLSEAASSVSVGSPVTSRSRDRGSARPRPSRPPCASERLSLAGSRAVDGCPGGCSRRSQPPIPGETALCRQPRHPAPARAHFSSICSGAVSTITATSSSATNHIRRRDRPLAL